LTAAGFAVHLDASLRACHLKRWTLRSMIASDILDRGIPWTQIILRSGSFNNDLNLKSTYRACVVLSYVGVILVALAWFQPWLLWLVPVVIGAVVALSGRYYRYFLRQRGFWFVARVVPLHYLYHLYNGLSFATGTLLYTVSRWTRRKLPGALPLEAWRGWEKEIEIAGATTERDVVGA